MYVSTFSIAQNPTVISDSLVVMNRIYAKEKLIVDQLAHFKQDIKVNGSARIQTDLRVDGELRVDGTTKLNGDVKMTNLTTVPSLYDTLEFLIILPNGKIQKGPITGLGTIPYLPINCPPFDIPNPTWANGLNKIYHECDVIKTGLGTSSPQYKLDVRGTTCSFKFLAGNSDATSLALYNGFSQNSSQDLIQLGVKIGASSQIVKFKITNAGAIQTTNSGSAASLTMKNGTGHAVVIYSNSNNKILQLEDNGMLRARRIKVDEDTWADYVFDKDYKLPKLTAVAKFIDKNHHLPGVPSADEINKHGLDLGAMQTIQMQKIEELTLYMIEMDEKMSAMETRMNHLEKENEDLKKNQK